MERFLPNLSCLTHLTLHAKGSIDLVDGHRWERLSSGFTIFNFKFNVIVQNTQQMLDSFRTSFWLREKLWYVAYENEYLFSVREFAPTDVVMPYNPQLHTAPDKAFL
jgi:hypothetical protein